MKNYFLLQTLFVALLLTGCSGDDDSGSGSGPDIPVVESAVIDVESGGSTEPNQVYIDLSTEETKVVRRDAWELGFYSGSENRVFLNASILVTAAELPGYTDIDAVNSSTVFEAPMQFKSLDLQSFQPVDVTVNNVEELKVGLPLGYGMYGDADSGISFTDSTEGQLNGTAIAEVSTTDADNKVYIVSAGSAIPDEAAEPGSINTSGDPRGFYKIRVLTDGNEYTLQYAELDAETHQEVKISKDAAYNIKAFSLVNGEEVDVEPAKNEWDINFTSVYSYYGDFAGTVAGVTFSDFAVHNTLGGTGVYTVFTSITEEGETTVTDAPSFEDFSKADVEEAEFVYNDKTVIGSDWRQTAGFSGGEDKVSDDRYYIVKDADGNYFKLQFTAFLNAGGERGYPQFKYELLE
ncbi:HmuY family protein [Sinomicrobium sp.]